MPNCGFANDQNGPINTGSKKNGATAESDEEGSLDGNDFIGPRLVSFDTELSASGLCDEIGEHQIPSGESMPWSGPGQMTHGEVDDDQGHHTIGARQ